MSLLAWTVVRVVAGVQFLRQGISNLIIKSLILAPSRKGVASNEDSHFPRFTWNIRGQFSSPEEVWRDGGKRHRQLEVLVIAINYMWTSRVASTTPA